MRLIDADAFKKYIRDACNEMSHVYKDGGKWAKQITEDFCIDIDEQPTIEERKTGKWIYGENKYGHDGWQCDQCGHWILWDYHVSMEDAERDLPKYCPNCGARMMQEGEGDE